MTGTRNSSRETEHGGHRNTEDDPWALPELKDTSTPWADLDTRGRVLRVVWNVVRFVLLPGLLYMFICSLDILSSAFRLLGGKVAGQALSNTGLFSNPIAGLMLGVLSTVLLQSSSTSTSIIVSMVSTDLLPVYLAIFIVMGANIGTTVTNTIVSIGQASERGDFRRAFAAASVHDMFNWLTVLVLLPLEWASGYLFRLTYAITADIVYDPTRTNNPQFLETITSPFTDRFVQLSSSKIRDIAQGKEVNGSLITGDGHMFSSWSHNDAAAGGLLLVLSLLMLCVCLVLIVKLLASLLQGTIAKVLQRFINSDLPGVLKHLTGYLAILIGAGLTILVQSSSIFTSALTPLVGVGAIHIDRMYPLTLGSNIGTTVTGILAALASDPSGFKNSFQVALCHLFFNISGILIWYPIPFMRRVPIGLAKRLGDTVYRYRWFAFAYLVLMFFLLPLAVFGLSLAGWPFQKSARGQQYSHAFYQPEVGGIVKFCYRRFNSILQLLLGMAGPFFLLAIFVVVVNILQARKPSTLPEDLRSWEQLPEFLRSLAPYDRLIVRMRERCSCCDVLACRKSVTREGEEEDCVFEEKRQANERVSPEMVRMPSVSLSLSPARPSVMRTFETVV